jgi:hypothetical protein
MSVFAIKIKLADVPAVQRPHDANPREHHRPAKRCDQDQGFHCCLPFCGLVLSVWQLRDEFPGVL